MKMKKSYRAALVGLGNIAWVFDSRNNASSDPLTHASSYINNDKTILVGGCSPDDKHRSAFEEACGVPAFVSLEELFEHVEPNIVSICSPTELHFEQVMYCLDRNIPMIWLEKPPAHSLQELDRMIIKLSEQDGSSTVLVNYWRRYAESYRKLRAIYSEESLGRCRLINISYSRGLELNGSHLIDLLFSIVGDSTGWELEWVSSFGNPENPCFALTLANGLGVLVSGIDLPYNCADISLVFEDGRASILHGGMTTVLEDKVEHDLFPGFYRLRESTNNCLGEGGIGGSIGAALDDLIWSYEQDERPRSDLRSARNALDVIESVRKRQRSSDR